MNPVLVWIPKGVTTGFRAALCGACGHTRFCTMCLAEILESHKKCYTGQMYSADIIPIP